MLYRFADYTSKADWSVPDSISISGRRRQGVADFHIAVRHRPIVGALGGSRAGVGGIIIKWAVIGPLFAHVVAHCWP